MYAMRWRAIAMHREMMTAQGATIISAQSAAPP
jgi:hypothetical protein